MQTTFRNPILWFTFLVLALFSVVTLFAQGETPPPVDTKPGWFEIFQAAMAVVIAVIVLARLIVKLTPTPADDTLLEKIVSALKHIGLNVKLLIFALVPAALLLTGCTSLPTNPDGTVRPNKKIEGITYIGTTKVLQRHPEYRAGFLLAASELTVIEAAETIDFATVLEIVSRLPVKELEGEDAMIYITGVTILLEDYAGLQVDLSKTPQLRSAVSGLRRGIERGLGITPTTVAIPFSAVPPPN